MNLFDKVSEDIKKAMLARDKVRLEALRGAKKEFLEAKTAKGANGELSDENAVKIIIKMVKQRKESARIYNENNRPELAGDRNENKHHEIAKRMIRKADNELAEAAVLEEYLPRQLSAEELDAELRDIIAETGASSAKDMGKVMGAATKRLAGRAEGRAISEAVKRLLA
jgi:hypothetical protein